MGPRAARGPIFSLRRLLEVVGKHLVGSPLRDLGSDLDRRAEVDAAPDTRVLHVTLKVTRRGEAAVTEPGQAGNREVDLLRLQKPGDDTPGSRRDAGVCARVLRVVRRRR